MVGNMTNAKNSTQRRVWVWRGLMCVLLLVLLASGFIGVEAAHALASAPGSPATVSLQRADAAPSLEMFNGALYVGWTGRNAAHNLNLMTYDPATRSFSSADVLTDTTFVGSGPSLANFYGNLYVAWLGTDYRLNVGRYNMANPSVLADKVTLPEHSPNAPVLSGFNGRLYLGWRGMDGRLNLISSNDGLTFGSKVTYPIMIRTSPSLVAANMYLYVCWENMSNNSHIVAGYYDPSYPTDLKGIVTLNSTSLLPVGVSGAGVPAPWAHVAWRTASDARIRLGIFEGDAVLHRVIITTQTTPYTPALFDSAYMCWTGTNAAQNINVSAVNM